MIQLILMVFAFVLLCIAAAGVSHPRVSIGWAGMAFWALSILLNGAHLR